MGLGTFFDRRKRPVNCVRDWEEHAMTEPMDLLGASPFGARSESGKAPKEKIERELQLIVEAQASGRAREVIERVAAASSWLSGAPVRRELRVALPRERGLAHMVLDEPSDARQALSLALEQAHGGPALRDELLGALAHLELMDGRPERAEQHLAERRRDRRATLLAAARLALYRGELGGCESTLQACEQAPGGAIGCAPPSTTLRALAALWAGRAEQARMLYDGVASRDNDFWEMVRLMMLRASWRHSGDARYLQLAASVAEELRFGDAQTRLPGVATAAAAQHAAVLLALGEFGLAADAADRALGSFGRLSLPEWPKIAVLHELAIVYRDIGADDRLDTVRALAAPLRDELWAQRVAALAGPRAVGALDRVDDAGPIRESEDGWLGVVALDLITSPGCAYTASLRAIVERTCATGGRWEAADGERRAATGIALSNVEAPGQVLALSAGERVTLWDGDEAALASLDRRTLLCLAAATSTVAAQRAATQKVTAQLELSDTARKHAEASLERSRRRGTADGHGGIFPSVVGRSRLLAEALDRLGSLVDVRLPVIIEGPAGSGRRHLAHALARKLAGANVHYPAIDISLVPPPEHARTIDRVWRAERGVLVVLNVDQLEPMAAAALDTLSRDLAAPRLILTVNSEQPGSVGEQLLERFGAGRVTVAGLDRRLEDVPLLIDAFAQALGRKPDVITTAARAVLARRAWPGHITELRTTIEHAIVRAGKGKVQPEHLDATAADARTDLAEACGLGYHDAVREFRRDLLRYSLGLTAGNRTRAAELLGLQRTYFMRLIRDLAAND